MDKPWLKLRKIIDTFHLRNHSNPLCHTPYSPQQMKDEKPCFNTQAGEQTFVWTRKFKNIVCTMGMTHHLFYLHRMVRRRNRYTQISVIAMARNQSCWWLKVVTTLLLNVKLFSIIYTNSNWLCFLFLFFSFRFFSIVSISSNDHMHQYFNNIY